MSKKNMAEKAQNENVNAVVTNPASVIPELEKAKSEAARLADEAKKAAKAAKEAAKAAKEAAEKAKVFSGRPVRLARFEAQLGAEVISKTDVHYCAEKAAIDYVADLRNSGEYTDQVIEIWKVYKDEQWAEKNVCLSKVYVDATTGQIVID